MSNPKDKYIRIPEDINFLLDVCRFLLRMIKNCDPTKELPVSVEELKKLRNIKHIYTK